MPSTQTSFSLTSRAVDTTGDAAVAEDIKSALAVRLFDGTGAGKASIQSLSTGQVVNGATDTIDTQALPSGIDALNPQVATKIKALIIRNLATEATYDLEIGAAAANPWLGFLKDATDVIVLKPGCGIMLLASSAVTDGIATAALNQNIAIKGVIGVAGTAPGVDYEIIVIGE